MSYIELIILFQSLLESICDGEIFVLTDDDEEDYSRSIVNTRTTAIVKNVCILQMILTDWHLMHDTTSEVQEILWKVLEALVRPDHPNFQFNVVQFQRARVVENLLMGCQVSKPCSYECVFLCALFCSFGLIFALVCKTIAHT